MICFSCKEWGAVRIMTFSFQYAFKVVVNYSAVFGHTVTNRVWVGFNYAFNHNMETAGKAVDDLLSPPPTHSNKRRSNHILMHLLLSDGKCVNRQPGRTDRFYT